MACPSAASNVDSEPRGTAYHRLRVLTGQLIALPAASSSVKPNRTTSHALTAASIVVVTGAAGFVGAHLVVKLLARGHTVRACVRDAGDSTKCGFLAAMPEFKTGQLTLHSADMTQARVYDEIFEGAFCVFHPAEVFMKFSAGKDVKQALQDIGEQKLAADSLNVRAMASLQHFVDSVSRSSTMRRVVYTSSVAALVPGLWEGSYVVNESREPNGAVFGRHSYGVTKRASEHFLSYHAMLSGGKWSAIICNPGDIIGPVLSPHQVEGWNWKLAGVLQGRPAEQEATGRPWMTVDVRDVAECHVQLAERCTDTMSGQRYLLASSDLVLPEQLGPHINALYPDFGKLPDTVVKGARAKQLYRNSPEWLRVNVDNSKVREFLGVGFYGWDDTVRATVDSLIAVGGIRPLAN